MNNIINYEEIMSKLSEFSSLREANSGNYQAAKNGYSTFSNSGVNISSTGYGQAIGNNLAKMSQNSEILQADYDRIIRYLTNLAQKAQESANKAVTTLEAREVWNATETVDG